MTLVTSTVGSSSSSRGVQGASAASPASPLSPQTGNTITPSTAHEQCKYLLSCLTMGVDLLVPLYKATAATSRCLPTDASFKPDVQLRGFLKAFVAAVLRGPSPFAGRALVGGTDASAAGTLSSPPPTVGEEFFSSANGGQHNSTYHCYVYPTLATGVIRPLDALRRSMQPIVTPSVMMRREGQGTLVTTTAGMIATTTVSSLRSTGIKSSSSSSLTTSPPEAGTSAKAYDETASCQLFISGKQAAAQPLLCKYMGITHIVRCFAVPQQEGRDADAVVSPIGLQGKKVVSLPSDSSMLKATVDKGGDWLTVLPSVTIPRAETPYRYDTLEYPVGMLLGGVEGELGFGGCGDYDGNSRHEEVYRVQRLTIPAIDDDTYDISQHFTAEVFTFISAAIAEGGRVLIHCAAGKHRSAAVAAAYLIDLEVPDRVGVGSWHGTSMPPSPEAVVERCYAILKASRPMTETTPTYKRQLELYAKGVLLARGVE